MCERSPERFALARLVPAVRVHQVQSRDNADFREPRRGRDRHGRGATKLSPMLIDLF